MTVKEMRKQYPSCEHCVYWVNEETKTVGQCRRNAPRPVVQQIQPGPGAREYPPPQLTAIWPTTTASDFCGKFRTKHPPTLPPDFGEPL